MCRPRGEEGEEGKNRATGEGLRRDMSKCLFMPNWATDEPAAISDDSLSRREEETDMKEGKDMGHREVLQRRNEEQRWGL